MIEEQNHNIVRFWAIRFLDKFCKLRKEIVSFPE